MAFCRLRRPAALSEGSPEAVPMTVERGTIRMGLCFDYALSPEEQQQIETRIAQLVHAADSEAILELVRFEGEPCWKGRNPLVL